MIVYIVCMYWPGGLYKQELSNGSTGNSGVGGSSIGTGEIFARCED